MMDWMNEDYDLPNKKGRDHGLVISWISQRGCQMHKKESDGRTWRPQHGRSPSPAAPPAVPDSQSCSSPSLGINATAPIERTGRLSGASPRLFTKTPTPPAPLFSRTRTHTLPDSNRRRRRRESRDSPSASGGLRPPVPPVVPSPQTAFAPVPSPLPRRGP